MHTYIHACIHTHIHIHTHAYIHIHTYIREGAVVDGSDLRWHSAEKQKRLIHTAPVLAPSSSKQSPQPDSNVNHHHTTTHGKMHGNTSAEVLRRSKLSHLQVYVCMQCNVCMCVYSCMYDQKKNRKYFPSSNLF